MLKFLNTVYSVASTVHARILSCKDSPDGSTVTARHDRSILSIADTIGLLRYWKIGDRMKTRFVTIFCLVGIEV